MKTPALRALLSAVVGRSVPLVSSALVASLFHVGCTVAVDPAPAGALRGAFPAQAARVLEDGKAIIATGAGFLREAPGGDDASGPDALSTALPRFADDAIHVSLPGGFEVSVREHGVGGEGRIEERSVVYRRAGGTAA